MKNLRINNFKCFYNIDIPINKLTILAGGNGNGKSTVIQALLLLRRTVEHCALWTGEHYLYEKTNGLNVELNGVYCLNLGNSENILPSEYQEPIIQIGITQDHNSFIISYDTNDGSQLWITPESIIENTLSQTTNPLLYQEFYYLNAERIGPRIAQQIKFYDYPSVGYQGEYTAQIISDLDSDYTYKIESDRVLNDKKYLKGSRFQHHINAWLSYILDGVTIIPEKNNDTHTSRIVVENSYSKGKPVFATNTGFGISYSLPIIVSGLIAKEDRILIIENPEAHLHPSAQSKMGYFLGVMANSGINIIVETHSDHVINGVQLAVAKKTIDHQHISINYFTKETRFREGLKEEKFAGIKEQPLVKTITLNEKGELSEWPSGFFDQTQKDYSNLVKLRRNV